MEVDDDVEAQKQQEQEPSRKLQRFSDDVLMRNWNNPSSRIIRVSRASGGKDRHSKVLTCKGLRDRRIRLSVSTAIQFYDLQDRLGFDQPSKAVEWLINAAADSISDLSPINTNFDEMNNQQSQNQTKSAGSSGTSESSLLSLSRTEIRGKARERARERTAKERDKDLQNDQSSFTQLLTGGFDQPNQTRNWTSSSDCFNPVQLIPNSSLPQFNNNHRQESSSSSSMNHQNHFSFVPDYSFGISSSDSPGAAATINGGYSNRGTLQSNSQSLFLNNNNNNVNQRSSSPMDSQSISFFMATPPPLDHHTHHPPADFDGRLYLYYGDENRSSDDKAKETR